MKKLFFVTILGLSIFKRTALAVGVYEAPCRSEDTAFFDARLDLEKCFDRLEQGAWEKSDEQNNSPRCLNELKKLNDKVKLLRECRQKGK